MPYDPSHHHRRFVRYRGWDYAANGAYFVTLATHERAMLFGAIVDGVMQLNEMGEVAVACWASIPEHFKHVEIDAFVVMPNHVHGIVMVVTDESGHNGASETVGAQHCCTPTTTPSKPHAINVKAGSLGAIIRSYKSVVVKQINQQRGTPAAHVWQRNYYERIIRNEREWMAVRDYIINNPARWAEDQENAV